MITSLDRVARHTRITWRNYTNTPTPPFLILFINSICNQKCEHCFYWRNLNRRDDLTTEELFALSRSFGRIENLNLSGGEPFLRPEFGQICRQFIQHNKVRQIYVPTNGSFTEKTITQITETLKEKDLDLFVAEISLDGVGEFHNKFRGSPGAFEKAMATYDALAELQKQDPRLRIHSISTATEVNMDEIRRLTAYLFERCPAMDHHNLAMIRGDRKTPRSTVPTSSSTRSSTSLSAVFGPRVKKAATVPLSSPCCSGPNRELLPSSARSFPAAPASSMRLSTPTATSASANSTPPSAISANTHSTRSGTPIRPTPSASRSLPKSATAPTKSSSGPA
jgi:pyruvate-formate lyase-activating enzyme